MICSKCGKEIVIGTPFCPYCGNKVISENKIESIEKITDTIEEKENILLDKELKDNTSVKNKTKRKLKLKHIFVLIFVIFSIGGLIFYNNYGKYPKEERYLFGKWKGCSYLDMNEKDVRSFKDGYIEFKKDHTGKISSYNTDENTVLFTWYYMDTYERKPGSNIKYLYSIKISGNSTEFGLGAMERDSETNYDLLLNLEDISITFEK